ncbi:MAG: plasmid mobilization relaxosome protein MobC [Microbacteriaceae bacterium]
MAEKNQGFLGRRRRANVPAGEGRVRHEVVVSQAEELRLLAAAELRDMTVPRLLVEAGLEVADQEHGGVLHADRRALYVEVFDLNRKMAGVANNINQIARQANSRDAFTRAEAEQLTVEARELYAQMRALVMQLEGVAEEVSST